MRYWGWVAMTVVAWSTMGTAARADEAPAPPSDQPPDSTDEASPTEDERGVDLVVPVGRLGWGTSQSVEPGDLGGFTFDLVVGSKLLFQELGEAEGGDAQRWRPVITGELGYTRRAGDYDGVHDLTVGLGFGFSKMYGGVHLFETVVFGVSDGPRYGLRTTLRLEALYGLFFLDVGHEVDFLDGATTHDIRGVIGVDVGLLVALFVMTSLLH